MGCEQSGDFDGAESGIAHPRKDLVSRVGRLGHSEIGRRARDVGTTGQELEPRAATAVGDTDSASELNARERVSRYPASCVDSLTSQQKKRCF